MAKKYCKKSSVQSLANEVKIRKGSSSGIQGSSIASDIDALILPTQRGSPDTVLTAENPFATIQRGKFSGGSVSVVPQNATATLSQDGGYVSIENGETLASVKIPATNLSAVEYKDIPMASGQSSFSVSNLLFSPVGYAIFLSSDVQSGSNYKDINIAGLIQTKSGVLAGRTLLKSSDSKHKDGYEVISTSATFASNSVSVSNIVASNGSTSYNCAFANTHYICVVWG